MNNRIIKFRIWNSTLNKLIYSDQFIEIYEFFESNIGDEEQLMQFSGIYDKDGKEIYEGDILLHEDGSINLVRWAHEDEDNYPGFRMRDLFTQNEFTAKIIGNNFENPELLIKVRSV